MVLTCRLCDAISHLFLTHSFGVHQHGPLSHALFSIWLFDSEDQPSTSHRKVRYSSLIAYRHIALSDNFSYQPWTNACRGR